MITALAAPIVPIPGRDDEWCFVDLRHKSFQADKFDHRSIIKLLFNTGHLDVSAVSAISTIEWFLDFVLRQSECTAQLERLRLTRYVDGQYLFVSR